MRIAHIVSDCMICGLLSATVIAFASAGSSARILHMTVSGSDASGDGSVSNPYATLRTCIRAAAPGDTIYVHEGKYPNEPGPVWYQIKGQKNKWILISGAPDESKPIFSSTRTMGILDGGDDSGDSQYFELRNLIWRKDDLTIGSHNINMWDGVNKLTPAHHVIIDGCEFYNSALNSEMIKMAGVDTFIIRNSRFSANNAHSLAIAGVGCHSGEISGCVIDSCMMGGIEFKGGSSDIAIHNNYIHLTSYPGIDMGGDTWYEYCRPDTALMEHPHYEARRLYVYSNVFVDNNVPIIINTCRESKIYNNLIIRTGKALSDDPTPPHAAQNWGLIWIMQRSNWCPTPPARISVDNNVFYFNKTYWKNFVWRNDNYWAGADECDSSATFDIRNNAWYCYEDTAYSYTDWTDGGRAHPIVSDNVFSKDPLIYTHLTAGVPLPGNSDLLGRKGTAVSHPLRYLFKDYLGADYTIPPPIGPINLFPEHSSPPSVNSSLRTLPGDIHR